MYSIMVSLQIGMNDCTEEYDITTHDHWLQCTQHYKKGSALTSNIYTETGSIIHLPANLGHIVGFQTFGTRNKNSQRVPPTCSS